VDDAAYWAFSFDEMGKFDLPAAFGYILNVTRGVNVMNANFDDFLSQFFAAKSFPIFIKPMSSFLSSFLKLSPYTRVGFELTTHSFSLLGGRLRRYH
jgi:hypothetical protein